MRVKFQLERADGTLVTPVTTPRWIAPIQGNGSTDTPNELKSADPATVGRTKQPDPERVTSGSS